MQAGEKLAGRYVVVKTLGSGGFGTTYLARDTQRPGQPACVVKHLKPDSQDEFVVTTARRLFNSEAEILEKLGKHDQIPSLLAYFEQDGEFYLVQEFIEGHPLSQEMQKGVPWPQEKVVRLLADVLTTLDFVHRNGVIHRDIKPDNLIRRKSDGKLVLIDFGAVKQIRDPQAAAQQRTGATVAIGTVGYAPAEQAQGKPQFASDIYSLGIVAICALTGKQPDQLESDPQTGELVWRPGVQVSHALGTVLDRMVRYHYSKRYANAGEVLAALRSFHLLDTPPPPTRVSTVTAAAPAPTTIRRPSPPTQVTPPPIFHSVVWKYGAITAVALIVIGLLSIPFQALVSQRIRRVEPSPAPTTPVATPNPEAQPIARTMEIDLPPNSTFQTERVLQTAETHLYTFKANPNPGSAPLELVLALTASDPLLTAHLIYPNQQAQENIREGTYKLSLPGVYGIKIAGGRGSYQLQLRLVAPTPEPSPTPEAEEEPTNPVLRGR
ncbi:MAG: serine/threonine protein kinase [Gloeomargarita sp. SKYG116]|nr:serine/threonine protein kinase [Gloeomargarita sp. SKYG116]MCS7293548.1 serine/threonine protein kinase [Gloeomargarita sp. SKYB120]MDW8179114.1 serine/threonine-protein kinase [Gloeomargarita sp. SKYBB_i_bin120]MDW8401212.1 serine/threonine-protein kinase [Gloeomargarita sp. SKYGB_i_bin116]